ncbi:hypothetical protein WQQ_10080 [Hydrocarboniphaga effusa AP103]|uniref:Uncharacterized protein n=1 Tax=Hydrocarboniphaga effusa AP103 TaxID=1172194 RepID=I8I403_9GAMM|nr:hypothetical protein WQQ_10080 [Hydrocarboniphaga effusa AP103]
MTQGVHGFPRLLRDVQANASSRRVHCRTHSALIFVRPMRSAGRRLA